MENQKKYAFAILLLFSLSLTGCTDYYSSVKDNITVKDSLALHGYCIIAGKIIDDETDEPVRDANVVVYSKPVRAVTDLYGQFEILDIDPGTYTLQVFSVGYLQRDIPDVTAKPDRLIRLDIRLKPRPDRRE
ncbi:MAG: carboxypeptidase-like regulatory domain-containing protein [Bacteroidetes bacterium]|nr:carboxypeptidase-like regulatory domain-containing protein [Bacteroidota bacterium]